MKKITDRPCSAMLCLGDVKVLSMTLRGLGPWSVTKGSVSEAAARGVDSVAEPKPITGARPSSGEVPS
jgi:hypothetical protein